MEVLPSALSVQLPTSHSLHSNPRDLNRAYRGQGDSCQLLYFSGIGNLLHSINLNIFLDFDQDSDQACPPPFLVEQS